MSRGVTKAGWALLLIGIVYGVLLLTAKEVGEQKPDAVSQVSGISAYVSYEQPLKPGVENIVELRLLRNGQPVGLSDLKTVHTQKIHLLIVDPTLTDYHHEHPVPLASAGSYSFSVTPLSDSDYRLWMDITPEGGTQEFLVLDLKGEHGCAGDCVKRDITDGVVSDGKKFSLSLPRLKAGESAMGAITVTDLQGAPVTNLEPVLGAFAHIVGFYDDYQGVAHMHPMGQEPQNESDRSGPALQFHMQPEKAGFMKLFAQFKIDGKTLFIPFGVEVER